MTTEYDPALVERIVAWMRAYVYTWKGYPACDGSDVQSARLLVAELPAPVDPNETIADRIDRIYINGLLDRAQRRNAVISEIMRVRAERGE